MIHWHHLGRFPPKPHTAFYDEGRLLMEHCHTRAGFEGAFSILYYRTPPTDENAVADLAITGFCPFEPLADQPLHRRHLRTPALALRGDFLDARRVLLFNADVHISLVRPTAASNRFFSNGDGDELYFAHRGAGRFETLFGVLPFRAHDYVLIPRGTPYRLAWDGGGPPGGAVDGPELLVFEGRGFIDIPQEFRNRHGQITMYAPYSHRDFRLPLFVGPVDEQIRDVVVKRGDAFHGFVHEHSPLDVVGWDGTVYPWAFPILCFQPRVGLVHLPPTWHGTFAARGALVCSFVPRPVDFHPEAIPCPYPHSSTHCDEIIFYCDGNFTSRRGVGAGSLSHHPMGIPHGPHPGSYEKSIGTTRTDELAVMVDTFAPLTATAAALAIEDAGYQDSFV
jgi:homogentisate 1,2-dioxygenase